MWKAALFTLCLLVVLVVRVSCNDSHPSLYGVKLCGRERSLGDSALIGEEGLYSWAKSPIPQLTSQQDPDESKVWKGQILDVAYILIQSNSLYICVNYCFDSFEMKEVVVTLSIQCPELVGFL
uniref:Secreted protein n=1 Tax=Echeneis naucrates TaxID=173247 RepID=A0A665TC27_ECHNA